MIVQNRLTCSGGFQYHQAHLQRLGMQHQRRNPFHITRVFHARVVGHVAQSSDCFDTSIPSTNSLSCFSIIQLPALLIRASRSGNRSGSRINSDAATHALPRSWNLGGNGLLHRVLLNTLYNNYVYRENKHTRGDRSRMRAVGEGNGRAAAGSFCGVPLVAWPLGPVSYTHLTLPTIYSV